MGSNPTLSAISTPTKRKLNKTDILFAHLENYSRGRRGAPAKGVGWVTAARVQIPHSPPGKGQSKDCPFRIYNAFSEKHLNPAYFTAKNDSVLKFFIYEKLNM